ncbi:uncharacterized protein LOC131685806 [Topomyia yanbarensis]|uniref:uncharacterized protein LOC131685806 n=1 Tax=Topomyia yanbarensis TaxID=2498891 RepID=UPI00273B43E3|nr:uncharacterized protein LOC131685806 [Topomyia yanbarensis]
MPLHTKHNVALSSTRLLSEADRSYRAGRETDAIYYSTEALCTGLHNKFDNAGRRLPQSESSLVSILGELNCDAPPVSKPYDPAVGFPLIHQRCLLFPEQWTIFQINKSYTPRWNLLTHQQRLQERTSIDLVLFTYPNSEIMGGKPIMIRIDPPNDLEFYSLVSSIPVKVKKDLQEECESGLLRHEEMETYISNVIDRLTAFLGPWIVLFSGKFISSKDQQVEAEIFNRVEDFCIVNKRSKRDQVLISLVARRLDMIDQETIYRFCFKMTSSDESLLTKLFNFLVDLKERKFDQNQRLDCYPCLMIVGELVDCYPWEAVNTNQEFSRLGSFRILWQLYEAHKANILRGYLRVPVKNCYNIINPDKSLVKMSARLQAFYKEWYPEFKLIVDQPPADGELSTILQEADVMIYNGHGSGLQFMDGDTILQHNIKSLIFLFGCDSVRLFPKGLFSEMTGSHLYYNIAKCAAIVGALWVLTDFYTDYYSIMLVGGWIPTGNPKMREYSVTDLDPSAFKNGTLVLQNKPNLVLEEHCEDNLLSLMALFRRRKWLPKRIRYAMVCRGLPTINDTYFDDNLSD